MGLVPLLWRTLAVFRVAALGYALLLIARDAGDYARAAAAWSLAGVMVAWTALIIMLLAEPARRRWPLLAADLTVAVVILALSPWVIGPQEQADTLPAVWVAAPVVAWAVRGGWPAGMIAAVAVAAADIAIRADGATIPQTTINATVLLLFVGFLTGYVATLAGRAERQLQEAAEREAATRERERLARGIHDSVLQTLALVQRRGVELGGEAAQLGTLAGAQEATLRSLLSEGGQPPGRSTGPGGAAPPVVELQAALRAKYAGPQVVVSGPAEPVPLPAPVATELLAAVGAALDNVQVHCGPGTPVWLLVEAEPELIMVTVRDEGPGIPAGRLAQAKAQGRLGVVQSIEGRLRELGGAAVITSEPGQGTEVELRLPLT